LTPAATTLLSASSLPGVSVIEAPRSVQGGGMPLMSTRRGDVDHVFQSPSQITVDRYRSGRIGIGGDTQTDIYIIVFADTVRQRVSTH